MNSTTLDVHTLEPNIFSEIPVKNLLIIFVGFLLYSWPNKKKTFKRLIFKNDDYRNDTAFQYINKRYITLEDDERKKNNQHLKKIIEESLIPLMKEDEIFSDLYERIMYGGSFYKGTRYGKPEEYDLDLILRFPFFDQNVSINTDHHRYGFVKIGVYDPTVISQWQKHRHVFSSWLTNDNYLDQDKFRLWFEGVFQRAVDKFKSKSSLPNNLINGWFLMYRYTLNQSQSGPAFTVIIQTPEKSVIEVDLVPSFEFCHDLQNGYRPIESTRNKIRWLVVPKPLEFVNDGNKFWRLCFYEHEKDLLQGPLKDVIRTMKKFRDTKNLEEIASYYIETIFYNEIDFYEKRGKLKELLCASKTELLMHGLKRLQVALEKRNIPYYWHPRHNLIGEIDHKEIDKYAKIVREEIHKINNDIPYDKSILVDIILSTKEWCLDYFRYFLQGISWDFDNLLFKNIVKNLKKAFKVALEFCQTLQQGLIPTIWLTLWIFLFTLFKAINSIIDELFPDIKPNFFKLRLFLRKNDIVEIIKIVFKWIWTKCKGIQEIIKKKSVKNPYHYSKYNNVKKRTVERASGVSILHKTGSFSSNIKEKIIQNKSLKNYIIQKKNVIEPYYNCKNNLKKNKTFKRVSGVSTLQQDRLLRTSERPNEPSTDLDGYLLWGYLIFTFLLYRILSY